MISLSLRHVVQERPLPPCPSNGGEFGGGVATQRALDCPRYVERLTCPNKSTHPGSQNDSSILAHIPFWKTSSSSCPATVNRPFSSSITYMCKFKGQIGRGRTNMKRLNYKQFGRCEQGGCGGQACARAALNSTITFNRREAKRMKFQRGCSFFVPA